jgi:hypothetical protein
VLKNKNKIKGKESTGKKLFTAHVNTKSPESGGVKT